MKLVLIAIALILLFPLLRRLTAKGEAPRSDQDEIDAEARARDESFKALMRTVLLLEENAWDACTIDGIREDWARHASSDVRGFSAVPAGRHRVETRIDGRVAVLDLVIEPGQVIVRRLDRASATWLPLEDDVRERIERAADGGEKSTIGKSLVSYRATMGIARVQTGKIKLPDAELARAKQAADALMARVTETDDAAALTAMESEARAAGEALIGVPLVQGQLDALVDTFTDRARLFQGKRREIARLALAMLPGHARLTALAIG